MGEGYAQMMRGGRGVYVPLERPHSSYSLHLKASVTIMADFSPEFNPPVRWRSKHQTKNDC